jgi:hypothetical protein
MNDRYRFEFWCGMTCYGGSEQKECDCSGPTDCQMQGHPHFKAQRDKAASRLIRLALKPLPQRAQKGGEG